MIRTTCSRGQYTRTLCINSLFELVRPLSQIHLDPDKATRHHRLDKPALAEHNVLLLALFTIHLDYMNVVHPVQVKPRIPESS
jgi:hypothetical protein